MARAGHSTCLCPLVTVNGPAWRKYRGWGELLEEEEALSTVSSLSGLFAWRNICKILVFLYLYSSCSGYCHLFPGRAIEVELWDRQKTKKLEWEDSPKDYLRRLLEEPVPLLKSPSTSRNMPKQWCAIAGIVLQGCLRVWGAVIIIQVCVYITRLCRGHLRLLAKH